MALDKGTLEQLRHLLRPLTNRVANTVARAVVRLVDDGKKMQAVQLGVLVGETVDNAEHFQPYGISAVPLVGAEAVVVFPNGDRSHPLVIAVSDRGARPVGGQPGDMTVYSPASGAKITMTKDGDIEVQPADGRNVFIRREGGSVDRLVTKSDFDGHTHPPGTFTTGGGGPVTGVSGGAAAATGTDVLRSQ